MKYLVGIVVAVCLALGAVSWAEDGYSLGSGSQKTNSVTTTTGRTLGSTNQNRKIFFNDTYFSGQNGFFDVGDNLRLSTLESELYTIKQENAALRQEIQIMNQQFQSLRSEVRALSLSGTKPGGEPPASGGGLIDPPFELPEQEVPNLELTSRVKSLFVLTCSKCHTEGRESGDLVLITKDGELARLSVEQIKDVYARTTLTPEELARQGLSIMPKGGRRLGLEQRNLVKSWANAELGL